MSVSKQRLYDLLPTYVRFRDQQLRDPELDVAPLEALIEALELPFHALEENVDALYRGWFIETCDRWKIPYLADLLGVRGFDESGAVIPSQRRRVANAIAYRRRKGTPAALARVAEDATGWPCHVTELRDLTAGTQALRTPRLERGGTADLRAEPGPGELVETFDRHAHSADLRQPRRSAPSVPGRGFRPDGLALVFWRLDSYPVSGATARPSARHPRRCYRFHPAGVDTALFNPPQTPTGTAYRSDARHRPVPLRRRELAREVAARRRGEKVAGGYLGHHPAFNVELRGGPDEPWQQISPEEMEICDLSDWARPRPAPDWNRAKVAIDPETGRIAFPEPDPDRQLRVDYSYGSSFDLGGGPYPREERPEDPEAAGWRAIVDRDAPPGIEDGVLRFASLGDALAAWRAAGPETAGDTVIRIDDSGHHRIGELALDLPADRRLTIRAADRSWPQLEGEVAVRGAAGSWLELEGVGVEGRLTLHDEASLALRHCTVHPAGGSPVAIDHSGDGSGHGEVDVDHSIVKGAVRLPASMTGLTVTDSIVDAGDGEAIRGVDDGGGEEDTEAAAAARSLAAPPGPPSRIERSTILGGVSLLQLRYAANGLFTGRVETARTREGLARHCYFVAGSTTPPRRLCLEGPRTAAGGWLRPAFTSTTYGHPGYAQLTPCSGEIQHGGEQGNEIGVFHQLSQGDRYANLRAVLDEYLPAGFTPRISFAT